MSNDVQSSEIVDVLQNSFVRVLKAGVVGLDPDLALFVARSLCEAWMATLSGLRVSVPSRPRVNAAAIEFDWNAGFAVREIMARNQCARSTAYKHHPARRNSPRANRDGGQKKK
jgi:hypothetical protein